MNVRQATDWSKRLLDTGSAPAPSAVVVLSPTTGPVKRPPTDTLVMDQKHLLFWPGTFLVRTGQPRQICEQ